MLTEEQFKRLVYVERKMETGSVEDLLLTYFPWYKGHVMRHSVGGGGLILEAFCEHNVGHTIWEYTLAQRESEYSGSHGCDGCCRSERVTTDESTDESLLAMTDEEYALALEASLCENQGA